MLSNPISNIVAMGRVSYHIISQVICNNDNSLEYWRHVTLSRNVTSHLNLCVWLIEPWQEFVGLMSRLGFISDWCYCYSYSPDLGHVTWTHYDKLKWLHKLYIASKHNLQQYFLTLLLHFPVWNTKWESVL